MKIVVGFGSVDAYPELVKAGADELFCGYVPFDHVSSAQPLNRREVRAVNTQIGSESELMILADMMRSIGVPVVIAFNALCYSPELLDYTQQLVEKCAELGFEKLIIADPALAIRIRAQGIPVSIHISGELGEMNRRVLDLCGTTLGAQRIIFHRRMAIDDMAVCIADHPELEYEAFALNELCHFHGGYCNTLHCDALEHMCRLPYRFDGNSICGNECDYERPGATGCGLCALWKLKTAGVTHLKIVGRGNYSELTVRDTKMMKAALSILETSENEDDYIAEMKRRLLQDSCSNNCYYLS